MTDLLELLDGTLVNTTALVDQVTGSGRLQESLAWRSRGQRALGAEAYLAGIDVADNDDVDMSLLLTVVSSSVMRRGRCVGDCCRTPW